MAKYEIEYPKNLTIQGLMSFPITSEADLEALQEWRKKRNIKKPKFADKISVNLLLNQANYDKAVAYLDEYLDFVNVLYKETNGDKGIEPDLVKKLKAKVKARSWSEKDLPIRELTEKDIEKNGDDFVAKLKVSGPFERPFAKKAVIRDSENKPVVVTLDELIDDGILPDGRSSYDELWWGSGWHFRTSLRMNAFDTASVGVSAYGNALYLLPHLGLPVAGGGDADVLEDGDDWED